MNTIYELIGILGGQLWVFNFYDTSEISQLNQLWKENARGHCKTQYC